VNRHGVDEADLEPEHAVPRLGVDQLDAGACQLGERRAHVVDLVRDVMHPRPALREEPADGRVVAERGKQLDAAAAHAHRRGLDALLVDPLAMLERRAEEAFVRPYRLVEIGDGDPDVMDSPRLHLGDAM